jgi:hypothetical protein
MGSTKSASFPQYHLAQSKYIQLRPVTVPAPSPIPPPTSLSGKASKSYGPSLLPDINSMLTLGQSAILSAHRSTSMIAPCRAKHYLNRLLDSHYHQKHLSNDAIRTQPSASRL